MRVLYLLVCICLTVNSAPPLNGGDTTISGKFGHFFLSLYGSIERIDAKTVEAAWCYYRDIDHIKESVGDWPACPETVTETPINGVNGWYVPFADGSLKWMDIDSIQRIQSFQNISLQSDEYDLLSPPFLLHNDYYDYNADDNIDFKPPKFWLYSKQRRSNISSASDFKKCEIDPNYMTVFVAQSFVETEDSLHLSTTVRNALFKKGNYNFIYVEWLGNYETNYIGASSQVPLIGKLMAEVFEELVHNCKMDCENTHLIGHGLGAHVVGFAAKHIKSCKVPRITALDAAYPLFPYDEPAKRLNSTDAHQVESIQTDPGFFGYKQPIGTISFNCSGKEQQQTISEKRNAFNHEHSIEIFKEAIVAENFLYDDEVRKRLQCNVL